MSRLSTSTLLAVSLGLLASTYASMCTGNPPTYNGLPCATTTRYYDGQMGACGCGTGDTSPFSWQWTTHTAAASQLIYDSSSDDMGWCGSGCGQCYEITPTGDCIFGSSCAVQNAPITIMVTNRCPYIGNEQWCPNPGNTNQYGYTAHFDLMDYNMAGWVSSLGWNNPVVTYRRVACGGGGSPTCADAAQCECSLTSSCASTGVSNPSSASASATTTTTTTTTATTSSVHPAATTTATTSSVHPATTTTTTTGSKPASTTTASSAASSASSSGTSSPAASGTCRAGISFALTSSWNGGGLVTITISNTGSQTITNAHISVPGGSSIASWNLAETATGSNVFTLPSWTSIAPGTQYTSSGYTFNGQQPAAGSIISVSC